MNNVASGSSPRVRGKPSGRTQGLEQCRIIPARAGQTGLRSPTSRPWPDHPRACGANCGIDIANTQADGSSPRVRGKLRLEQFLRARDRIIPARAGQTEALEVEPVHSADHPRACGANVFVKSFLISVSGSSPRVRGKQIPASNRGTVGRIIPARAGQTGSEARTIARCPDHPRACGANPPPA